MVKEKRRGLFANESEAGILLHKDVKHICSSGILTIPRIKSNGQRVMSGKDAISTPDSWLFAYASHTPVPPPLHTGLLPQPNGIVNLDLNLTRKGNATTARHPAFQQGEAIEPI